MPKTAKNQINSEQKEAVEHGSGPILVVAGAGTGKTFVITERIKWLLEKKEVSSNNILALTFTDKAAEEMENRVADVMPLGYEEPYINTFHAFCDRILKTEGLEIGLDPSYKILSGPQQWLLFRNHIFDFDIQYFRPLGNPTKFISAILKFISRLQDENISVEDLQKYTDNLAAENVEESKRWQELYYLYRKYSELKIENSRMDFGDLITWTIKLFEKRPNILKKYQEQFQHVLLDEFQDTNYSQYKLVKTLCPPVMGNRSLMAVGDDSQSIYKFRGAAVSNILNFIKDYPEAKMITLNKNYRSGQAILDSSYELIQNNNPDTLESKLGISKKLTSQLPKAKNDVPPEIIETETVDNEVEFVISKIYDVLAKEPELTYKNIAILARANNHLEPIVLALKKHGIPYQLLGNRGLYDQDEIRDVLSLLKSIINTKDSISLYRVLNIDAFNIPQQEITKILSQARYGKKDIWDILIENNNTEINKLHSLITKYQDKITKSLPVDFVYSLINESGYLSMYLQKESIENNLSIKNLNLFLEIVKKFETDYRTENKNIPTVIDMIDYIELLIEAGDNPAQAELEDIDTVNLLTVHAAKGLEFPVVFMINIVAGRFPTTRKSDMLEIPENLIKETLPSGDEHVQEERRLFYVGMTRAKKYLYMTYAKNYGGKRDKKPSGYLNETGIDIGYPEFKNTTSQQTLFGIDTAFRDPVMKKVDFTPTYLSFSQIESFKTCPLQYKYRYILSVPTAPSHALSYGITIHDTLRDFHQKLLFGKLSLEEMLSIYEKNWQPLGYIDEKHRNLRFEEGKRLVREYYEKHKDEKEKPLALERAFNIKLAGIRFYGRIDRIDKEEDGVEIIDYKTGQTKTQKEVDTDDQVAFYAIAAKEAMGMNPKKLTYYFLESGEKISTTRTLEQLEEKKEDVAGVIDEIKKGKFEAKSGMHCNWCDYKDICPFAFKN